MTPAEEAVLAAARAYRNAALGPDPCDRDIEFAQRRLTAAAMALVDAPPVDGPTVTTVTTVRPWPDPEACGAFVIKPLDPSKALPPGTDLSALFGVDLSA